MKNKRIPLNQAEAIFYPAFDKYLCRDEQMTVEGGEKERLWDSLVFRGGRHMVLQWQGETELQGYDCFLGFIGIPMGAKVSGTAVVNGRKRTLFTSVRGEEAPLELKGALVEDRERENSGLLTRISLDITSEQEQNVVVVSWLGLINSSIEVELEELVPVWQEAWEQEIDGTRCGAIRNNLVLSAEEGKALRDQIKDDPGVRAAIRENAEAAMMLCVEETMREYAPAAPHHYRFTRVRDRGRESFEGKILNLAIGGYLLEEPAYSRQAARMILALIAMKWCEGPICDMAESDFHHVCFMEDHLLTEVCLAVGFLDGVIADSAMERIINKAEEAWRFVRSKCMEPGYRSFMNQGIVGNRGAMLGAAFLQLWRGGYEAYLTESYERHCAIIDNYLTPNGHCAEGGNYFEYSFTTSILLWHVYSAICRKPVAEVVPERFKRSGRYLAAILSANDRDGRRTPLNCGGGVLSSTLLLVFMTMICDFPEGNNYLISRFSGKRQEESSTSFDLLFYLFYRKQVELHPYYRPAEEDISFVEEGLLTYRNGSSRLMVSAERNPLTGHFHEGRGGIVLEAGGEILLPELGTTNYSNPLCLVMDKKEYHNLACPADLQMQVESRAGMEAAAEAAHPIVKELRREELEIPEARVLCSEMKPGQYRFRVATGMLYGDNIVGIREGVMERRCLALTDRWHFEKENPHPVIITYLSYHPWSVDRSQAAAVSGSMALTVEAEGIWEFQTEEGMRDFDMRPVYVLRICSGAGTDHVIKSIIRWKEQEVSPDNTGRENTLALQERLNVGGTIRLEMPGVYEIEDTLIIKSYTRLLFGAGVFLKRSVSSVGSFAIINEGAFTGKCDTDITIEGLRLITNGVEARDNAAVFGLTGELSFFRVKHLRITDFVCLDLPRLSFGIHVCTFENLVIERVRIEGRKDAVHLGRGKKFTIRHGLFKTFDDPIALNAHDYAVANPQMGWIEDGLIEDCYDLNDEDTTGYFCRILAGAWCDWYEGMAIQNSDTVVSEGRVYRAFQKPDGTMYRSMTPPTHEEGMRTLDGIHWVMVQEEVTYQCGCRNIHFKDIHLQKKRQTALSIHFDHDQYSRSVYPGAEMPVQENLIFENLVSEGELECLVRSITPVDTVKIMGSAIGDSRIELECLPELRDCYPDTHILLIGNTFRAEKKMELVRCGEGRRCRLTMAGNAALHAEFKPWTNGTVELERSDMAVSAGGVKR